MLIIYLFIYLFIYFMNCLFRGATKAKAIIEQVDCNKHKNNLTEESNEKSWAQEGK